MPYFIVQTPSGIPRDPGAVVLRVIYAASKRQIPGNDVYVSGPYGKQTAANSALKSMGAGNKSLPAQISRERGPVSTTWLTGLGGDLASGIEGGVVALLGDLWRVISGPVLVIAGVIIAVIVLIVFFKNDITQAGASLGALARMGAA